MNEKRRSVERTVIRGTILFILCLAVLSSIAGVMPGTSTYDGMRLVETKLEGGWGYVVFCLGCAIPLALVWKKPRPMLMFAWTALIWLAGIVALALTFELNFDWNDYTYVHHVGHYLFLATGMPLVILVFVALPPVSLIYAIITKVIDHRAMVAARPLPPATLPIARVVV